MGISKIKRGLIVIFIVFLIPILTGCWNRTELNSIGIAMVIGLDEEDENKKVTVEVIQPQKAGGKSQGGSEEKRQVKYVQATGKSVFDAMRNITLKFDRRIFLSHIKLFIFSEDLAKKGLMEYIDFLQRDHEFRETAYIIIAKGASAADVMGVSGGIEKIPGVYIEDLMKNYKFTSKAIGITFIDFLRIYYDKGIQPTISIIEKKKKETIGETNAKEEYELSTEGAAVLLKDKLAGYLDGNETRGFNFIEGKVKSGIIVSNNSDDVMGSNAVEIISSKSKKNVELITDNAKISVNITIKGMLGEETGDINIREADAIRKIETATSQTVKSEVEGVIEKAQREYKSDIFGFGDVVHRKYPNEWKKIQDNWNDIFSQASVQVNVETNLFRTGLTSIPSRKEVD